MNKMVDDMIIKCNDSKKVLLTLFEYTDPIHPDQSDEIVLHFIGEMFNEYMHMMYMLNSVYGQPDVKGWDYLYFGTHFRALLTAFKLVKMRCTGRRIDSSLDKYLDSHNTEEGE